MPVWQQVYEEINDPNFVLICVAEDTGGEAAAGPIFDAAQPTFIQVVDPDHIVSSAFNFVNVPSSVWINEKGRIVRIDEGTYSKIHSMGEGQEAITFGNDVYTPALKDWVAKGEKSKFVQSAKEVTGNIREHTFDQMKADAAFRLANFFRLHGRKEKAEKYSHELSALMITLKSSEGPQGFPLMQSLCQCHSGDPEYQWGLHNRSCEW